MDISEIIEEMESSIENDKTHSIEHYSKAVKAAQYLCNGACDFFKIKNDIAKAYFNVKGNDLVFGAFIDSSEVPCISFSKTNFFLDGFFPQPFVVGKGSLTFVDKIILTRFKPTYYQTDNSLHAGFVWNDEDDIYVAEYTENIFDDLPRTGWIGKLKSIKDINESAIMIKVISPSCSEKDIQETCFSSFIDILPNMPSRPPHNKTVWNEDQWVSPIEFKWGNHY